MVWFFSQKTEGYSGSDIRLVCKEAAMRPVRKIFDALEKHTEGKELTCPFCYKYTILQRKFPDIMR